jgi:hypothetical protein
MTRTVRARRADAANQPLYARALRLRHLAPSGLLCFVFLEGAVVLGILLALAELVSWWGVIVLPFTVALMVKFNDLVAGAATPRPADGETASARATVLRPAAMRDHGSDYATPVLSEVPVAEPVDRPAGYGSGGTFAADRAGSDRPGSELAGSGWAGSGWAGSGWAGSTDDETAVTQVSRRPQRAGRVHVSGARSAEWAGSAAMSAGSGGFGPAIVPIGEQAAGFAASDAPLGDYAAADFAHAERSDGYEDAGSPRSGGYAASDVGGYPSVGSPFSEAAAGYPAADPVAVDSAGDYEPAGSEFAEGSGGYVAAGSSFGDSSGGYAAGSGFADSAGGYAAGGSAFAERSGGYAAAETSVVGYGPDGMAGAPAVGYPGSYSRGFSGNGYSQAVRDPYGSEPAGDGSDAGDLQARSGEEPRGNSASTRRPWADQLDVRQQMACQAASRRYE